MASDPKVYIGTSGFSYGDWVGKFFPAETRPKEMFAHYTNYFPTIEVNSTFYHITKQETYEKWQAEAPANFRFAIKLNRTVTHLKKLKADQRTQEVLRECLANAQGLGRKFRVLLIQLPPNLGFKNEKLQAFLDILDKERAALDHKPRIALEARHASWFCPEAYKLLRKHKIALVMSHSSVFPFAEEHTADFAYLRFHGPRKLFGSAYSEAELRAWAQKIRGFPKKVKQVYIYFNNDMYAYAPKNAQTLQGLLKQ